jgi:hypothetical protein
MMVKHAGHGSPAHVTREYGLLVAGGIAVFPFEFLQESDGRDIVAGLLVQSAVADTV